MPSLFENMIRGKSCAKKDLKILEKIIENVIKEDCVSDDLYDVKSFDDYTYIHCLDTGIMATYLAMCMKYNIKEIKQIGLTGMLHDIGKIKISNDIINKKGSLTKEELVIIKKHPIYGYNILKKNNLIPKEVREGVLQHHERADGEGYPFRLNKDEISDYAKIVSVCDVFTAVSAKRSYRDKFSLNEAYELIMSGVGTIFDKEVVKTFEKCFYKYNLGCKLKLPTYYKNI
ncbi:HD-GYP domain-containing protein [Haloimpatiens sp. FM7315]|uniref:HD-GYP domain-containing protein n=1 Tax=Haloimpatiens sp. FM7315 TaxID=3298609 RepID=UPI003977402D